ncbi:hypothetical protein [Mycobacterium deserti]|uniref:Uncharacterized protein n=1 Tax=Mycobacterium deserti TaxID=2978347 RepID=A0ABT2M8T0_9MYCO|nr:hypothetical protein [Mycobacterium deserti]MCT7658346.1 hypothetical protein [Mycobacterium deserti]
MTERSMADDSSEQVPGQQTGESSVAGDKDGGGDDGERSEQAGLGRDASAD